MARQLGEAGLDGCAASGCPALPRDGLALFDPASRLRPLVTFRSVRTCPRCGRVPESRRCFAGWAGPGRHRAGRRPGGRWDRLRAAGRAAGGRTRQLLLGVVSGHVAAVLGRSSAAAVEPGRAFQEMGFDSLAAIELRNRLATATGLSLPATVVFDQPTPTTMARYLKARIDPRQADPTERCSPRSTGSRRRFAWSRSAAGDRRRSPPGWMRWCASGATRTVPRRPPTVAT